MEEWKTCIYNGEIFERYEVSNTGKVRSLDYKNTGKIKELTQIKDRYGYLVVTLRLNGKTKQVKIHRLVAIAFIPNNDKTKTQVNHIDENKENNHVSNLEWVTHGENIQHGTGNERRAKTQAKRVRCIETGRIFDSIQQASRELGLKDSNIIACCKGKAKTCGKLHWEYVE